MADISIDIGRPSTSALSSEVGSDVHRNCGKLGCVIKITNNVGATKAFEVHEAVDGQQGHTSGHTDVVDLWFMVHHGEW